MGGSRLMIKSELVASIHAQSAHLYQHQAEKIVDAILDEIASAIAQGDRVELRGFGTFAAKVRSARLGRNPKNGKSVTVLRKVVPYFKPGKEMRERLNSTPADEDV